MNSKQQDNAGKDRPEFTLRQVNAIAAGRITVDKLLNQLKGRI